MSTVVLLLKWVFFIGLALGGYFLFKAFSARDQARDRLQRATWEDFARRNGLKFDPMPLSIAGTLEGRKVELTREEQLGRNNYVIVITRVNLSVDDALPWKLELTREEAQDKFLKLVGKGDAEVGEPLFDSTFKLAHTSPEALAVLRDPQVQHSLLEVVRVHSGFFALQNGDLELEAHGSYGEPGSLEVLLKRLFDVVRALNAAKARATPPPAPAP